MPVVSPNNWEPLPENLETGFAPDICNRNFTTEEIVAAMDKVAASLPAVNEKELLKRCES